MGPIYLLLTIVSPHPSWFPAQLGEDNHKKWLGPSLIRFDCSKDFTNPIAIKQIQHANQIACLSLLRFIYRWVTHKIMAECRFN